MGIFRGDIFDESTGRREFTFKRTVKYDSHMLDKPDFVGSYEIGDYVYFFFREIAVEYMNCGKNVYKIPNDDTTFFAVFTTNLNGLMGSAVCTFHLDDVTKAFEGKFKEQESSTSAWLPVASSKVPEPRPGSCVEDTRELPDRVLNFMRTHPLMDEDVGNQGQAPVFYKRDVIFTNIVVDKVYAGLYGDKKEF